MDGRHKSSRKTSESARPAQRVTIKGHPNEYAHLQEDFNALWMSWTTGSSTSDMWRRIEQNGIETALRKLGTYRSELNVISSISSDDAVNISGVMVELCEMLNAIRLAFDDNKQDIFDNDERESRYLTTTCPSLVEVWSNYTTFASQFATSFVQKTWLNSSEHRDLLAMLTDVVSSSTKLIVAAVNTDSFHNLENSDSLTSTAGTETTKVIMNLEENLDKIYSLEEKHTAYNKILELVGWQLHGVLHMADKVIKVESESGVTESDRDEYKEVTEASNTLTEKLKQRWPNKNENADEQQQQLQVQAKPERKQSVTPKYTKKQISKVEAAPPVTESTKQPREVFQESVQKLKEVYDRFSDDAWENKRLPVIRGAGGVQVKYRLETYDQIRNYKVSACAVHKRKAILDSLDLSSDYTLHSELFVVDPDGFSLDKDVIISFPLTSAKTSSGAGKVYLKVKVNGSWTDLETPEKEKIGETTFMSFTTSCIEAFTATSFSPRDALMVDSSGASFVSEDFGKVEVTVPQDCFSSQVTLGVKTLPFDKTDNSSAMVGVVSASVAVEISMEPGDVTMNKNVTIQVPLDDSDVESQRDTELVVVRYNNDSIQVLDKKQMSLKELGDNTYSVDVRGFWCVAVLRIRRIYLNMRESIKKEFLAGYGVEIPCNIVTFIDDVTRHSEKQTIVMEIIRKCDVEMAVDVKRGFGLIEVKKSRSKDVMLQRGDEIAIVIDGQLRVTEAITDGQNIMTYIPGARNTVFIQTEIKRDPEKLPDAMIFYKLMAEDVVIHNVAIMTRDLSELETDAIIARSGLQVALSDDKKDKQKEEAAVQILKMESLMSLARELTFEEGTSLGEQLGVNPDTMKRIARDVENDRVAANFQILCNWRGRTARATMADFLVSCLKAVGKLNYADLVMEVRTHNRGLERSDFTRMKALHAGKTA